MTFLSAEKDYGPGHAWLCLDRDASSDWQLEIEREASKDLYLGPNGWQGTPFGIRPQDAKGDRLLLGPDIVDHLRDGDLIVLRIPEVSIEIEDYWPDIPISGRSNKGESLLDLQAKTGKEGPKAPFQREEPIAQPQPVAPVETPVITPPPNRGWLKWGAMAVALIIWFGMGTMIWLYSDELMALIFGEPEQTETLVDQQPTNEPVEEPAEEPIQAENTTDEATPPEQEADASTAPDNASPDTQTAQNDQPPAAPVHDRAYWQGMLGDTQLSGEALYGASKETRDDAELVDIAQDFLRLSADKGHKPAQQEYAGLFDPTKDTTLGSISAVKNPSTALEYYRRLSQSGDQTAKSNIKSLCAHLKPQYFENSEARIAIDDYCN